VQLDVNETSTETGAPPKRRFPDFLCIGAQKAGTSWLYDNLRHHPDVWLPPVKEIHYFNHVHIEDDMRWTTDHRRRAGEAALRRYNERSEPKNRDDALVARLNDIISGTPDDDWYSRIFEPAGRDLCCGDITPRYASLPPAGVLHVRTLIPDAKIIYILRDPIGRCWSHIRMLMEQRGIRPDALTAIEKIARSPGVLDRSDYSSAFASWSAYASEGRLLTIFFEDIAENPAALLRKVCAFLSLEFNESFFAAMRRRVHAGTALALPPEIHEVLKSELRQVYNGILARFPERGEKWLALHYGDHVG
jgi:hypothetical protein